MDVGSMNVDSMDVDAIDADAAIYELRRRKFATTMDLVRRDFDLAPPMDYVKARVLIAAWRAVGCEMQLSVNGRDGDSEFWKSCEAALSDTGAAVSPPGEVVVEEIHSADHAVVVVNTMLAQAYDVHVCDADALLVVGVVFYNDLEDIASDHGLLESMGPHATRMYHQFQSSAGEDTLVTAVRRLQTQFAQPQFAPPLPPDAEYPPFEYEDRLMRVVRC
jgi:hypothetical protein